VRPAKFAPMKLDTPRLTLVLQTRAEVELMIAGLPEEHRVQISPLWLEQMRSANDGDPWAFAFSIILRESGATIGSCSYKGPPMDGVVEIAYRIDTELWGKGFATEAAQALYDHAASCNGVRRVCAHTLPDSPASQRVLVKCGFDFVGERDDPEDGRVRRFERAV
jgi:RimJ/RimL family protein N-acetyltransferase